MAHYIDKDALVAEERLKECNHKICAGDFDFLKESYPEHYYSTEIYNDIISFIDTPEVKEADLTKETDFYIENVLTGTNPIYTKSAVSHIIERTAKHFFQLGLKTAQKGE